MIKTLNFLCRGSGFDPWSGNYHPTCHAAWPKKKKKKKGKANLFPYRVTSMVGETINRKVIAEYKKSPEETSKGEEMQSDGEWQS